MDLQILIKYEIRTYWVLVNKNGGNSLTDIADLYRRNRYSRRVYTGRSHILIPWNYGISVCPFLYSIPLP